MNDELHRAQCDQAGGGKVRWRVQITDTDIHEAGHAVASAFLRVPFYRVYARNAPNDLGACVPPKKGQLAWIPRMAVISLASRAALEQYAQTHKLVYEPSEESFADDEAIVRHCASHLGIGDSEFSGWRIAMLVKAHDLISGSFVQEAIEFVAHSLAIERAVAEATQTTNKGLQSSEVRRILRYCKSEIGNLPISESEVKKAKATFRK